jgi:branched-chain amino acid transport system ATP-binding protein
MRFGGLLAINRVDLQVRRGQIVGLIGPNGAGKTTLFNCLTGMYRPTSGQVLFDGRLLPARPAKATQAGLARTFQNIRLFQNMTALENVLVGTFCRTKANAVDALLRTSRHRREEAESRAKALRLLEFVGLAHAADELARSLPYGKQRRLEIARALATDPKLLLLDEPTAGMNALETSETARLIARIRDVGLAVLVIEHDMRFIFNLCDRVTCLVHGEVLSAGSASEVQDDPRVLEAYIGVPYDPGEEDSDDGDA